MATREYIGVWCVPSGRESQGHWLDLDKEGVPSVFATWGDAQAEVDSQEFAEEGDPRPDRRWTFEVRPIPTEVGPDANGVYYCELHGHEQRARCPKCQRGASKETRCTTCGGTKKAMAAPVAGWAQVKEVPCPECCPDERVQLNVCDRCQLVYVPGIHDIFCPHGTLLSRDEIIAALHQWREQGPPKPRTEKPAGGCKCGLKEIPAGVDIVSWYWQEHGRDKCVLQLPNERCECGLLRSEHLNGHAEGELRRLRGVLQTIASCTCMTGLPNCACVICLAKRTLMSP